MTTEYPTEPVGGFPVPPRTISDRESRQIHLRRLEDTEALVSMYCEFSTEDRAQGIPPTEEPQIRDWLDIVTEDRSLNVVAWDGDCAVGHAMLVADDDGSYELAIFVLQAYQGAGIGTELLRTTLGAAQQQGIEFIWLSVERWNRAAIALYKKIGFETVENPNFDMKMTLRLETEAED
jgi:ribosomal protein S18 acetylase RimI-like enzyme